MVEAILLAAGSGRRLGAIGRRVPKAMLPLDGGRVVDYTLDALERVGCTRLTITLGHEATKMIRHLLNRAELFDYRFIVNSLYKETNNLYSLYLALQSIGQEPFILINGDLLFHPLLIERLITSDEGLIVDMDKALGEEDMKVVLHDGFLKHISKTVHPHLAMGEYVGLARFEKSNARALYQSVHRLLKKGGSDMFYEAAIDEMVKSGSKVSAVPTDGLPWIEIDTMQDLMLAKKISGGLRLEEGPVLSLRIHERPRYPMNLVQEEYA